ncbi:MAG: lathosterol oxidase [Myxococcota bacterium]
MNDIDWLDLISCVLGAVAGGLAIFHVTAGFYHVRYYRRRRKEPETWKIQEKRWPRPGHQRRAALMSSANLALGGLGTGLLIYAVKHGHVDMPLYYDVSDYGWTYTLLTTIALFVVFDGIAYYVHRALHTKWLFRNIHRHHHKFVATTAYVTVAVHPVELLVLQWVTFIPLFLVPLWVGSPIIALVYILVFNIIDHSGVDLDSDLPWQGSPRYHDDHHAHFHCNFGQHLMLWDRLHGTLRVPGRTYGKHIFGGRGQTPTGTNKPDTDDPTFQGYGTQQ